MIRSVQNLCSRGWKLPRSSFHNTPPNGSGQLFVHRNTPENNPDTKFELSIASKAEIDRILTKYPKNFPQSAILPALFVAQRQNQGFLSLSAMNRISEYLHIAPMRIYEVSTFYTMYNRNPVGRFHIQLCGTTPCQLCGAEKILETLEQELGITVGGTTPDKMFTLSEVECLGACVNAPMLQVCDWHNCAVDVDTTAYYEDLTTNDTRELIASLRKGKMPKAGSKYRNTCEPAGAVIDDVWVPAEIPDLNLHNASGPRAPNLPPLDKGEPTPPNLPPS